MKKQILKINSSFWQKRIPTILGLSVLVIGLVAGILIFGQGTGVFSPRATPETTPKQVVISNITERGFTVSFVTDETTPGYVKYGLKDNSLKERVGDDRDQIRGIISDYKLHHITVSGLGEDTQYFFILGTGTGDHYKNSGQDSANKETYMVSTAKRGGVAPSAKTVYGSVVTQGGVPANGAIVYALLEGALPMSSLVKESGSWAIPLSSARQVNTLDYATMTDEAVLTMQIQDMLTGKSSTINTTVGEFESGVTLTLGEGLPALADVSTSGPTDLVPDSSGQPLISPTLMPAENLNLTPTPTINPLTETASPSADASLSADLVPTADPLPAPTIASGGLEDLLQEADLETRTINLEASTQTTTTSTAPRIEGKAPSGLKVKIVVNSDTRIEQEVTADASGDFFLDLEELGKELEPGEHTVEYTYTDPNTGEDVTKVVTFTVAPTSDTSTQLALAQTTPSPTPVSYGTENPYPAGGASASAEASDSATASSGATASSSGTTKGGVSTRSATPSTESGVPVSGSVSTTLALILGGLFFIIAGVWSYWIASELQTAEEF
ncbi:MAG: hypothetical protein ABIJ03_03160 [Patescibacteria group bacterium]